MLTHAPSKSCEARQWHVKPDSGIFSNCWSCCVSGWYNTRWGRHHSPLFICISSWTPIIVRECQLSHQESTDNSAVLGFELAISGQRCEHFSVTPLGETYWTSFQHISNVYPYFSTPIHYNDLQSHYPVFPRWGWVPSWFCPHVIAGHSPLMDGA